MGERKTMIRFFTIADYEEEEIWLRERHKSGWRIVKLIPPCFYIFEACEPEDVVYRLDYRNGREGEEYLQLFKDYGWEYFAECMGWLYFRKPVSQVDDEADSEIFSDNESKFRLADRVTKTRMLPLLVIWLCAVLPNFSRAVDGEGAALAFAFCALMVVYVFLIAHCGTKLHKLRKKYDIK